MEHKINGKPFPVVEITLNNGESVVTQTGGMTWMDNDISMTTSTNGGIGKGIKRMLAGESVFQNIYTAKRDNQTIACAATLPGEIIPLHLDGEKEYIVQKGGFLAGEKSVNISTYTANTVGGAIFSGEGVFLLKLSGTGTVFLELGGYIKEIDLDFNEKIKVNTGNVAYFESSVDYKVERIKGAKNMFLGGEGLFNTTLTGPGKVYLQTMTAQTLASAINQYIVTG